MKLNEIAKSNNLTAYGFKAFLEFADCKSNPKGSNVVVSTLSPALMADMGITEYYSPVLPRGLILNTAEEVEQADLSVNYVKVCKPTREEHNKKLIVSRHTGTIELLREIYPEADVMSGNITPEDIKGAFVAGTLPPHLIQYVWAYRAFTISDFDYSKDGDLKGDELKKRGRLSDPIAVIIE